MYMLWLKPSPAPLWSNSEFVMAMVPFGSDAARMPSWLLKKCELETVSVPPS